MAESQSPEQRALDILNQGPARMDVSYDAVSISNAILIAGLVIARAIRGVPDEALWREGGDRCLKP